jgi:hypothetical protein
MGTDGSTVSSRVVASRTLTSNGGRVDWSRANDRIAFDRVMGADRSEVFTVRPDGTDERCVTCGDPGGLPLGIRGQPAWHPSGAFLVIQVQAASFDGNRYQFVSFGLDNDLWLVAADGTWAERLVTVGPCEASLHPHFSDSGDRLFWARRRRTGERVPQIPLDPTPCAENPWDGWSLAVAPFGRPEGGSAALGRATELFPSEGGLFESHALVGDTLWFSHTDGGRPYVDDGFTARVDGSARTNLTRSPRSWDEHASPSPAGRAYAFDSSRSFNWSPADTAAALRLELWMVADGGDPIRLTDLNAAAAPGIRVITSDFAWSPSGREIALYHADVGIGGTAQIIDLLTLDQAY